MVRSCISRTDRESITSSAPSSPYTKTAGDFVGILRPVTLRRIFLLAHGIGRGAFARFVKRAQKKGGRFYGGFYYGFISFVRTSISHRIAS